MADPHRDSAAGVRLAEQLEQHDVLLEGLEQRAYVDVEAVAEPGQVGGAADDHPLVASGGRTSRRPGPPTTRGRASAPHLRRAARSAVARVGDRLADDGAVHGRADVGQVVVGRSAGRARPGAARPGRSTRISTTSTRVGASATSSTWRTVERESVGYCTTATWWVSCESSRTERCTTSSRSTAPSRKRGDGALLGGAHRLERGQPVDEQPVALVGRDPAGAGVRLGDEPLLLQRGHVVADRGRRDAEAVPLDEGLGADRLLGGDVVLDDRAEHGELAVVLHGSLLLWLVGLAVAGTRAS